MQTYPQYYPQMNNYGQQYNPQQPYMDRLAGLQQYQQTLQQPQMQMQTQQMPIGLNGKVVDNAGKVASSYPGDTEKYPESVPTGAFCEAEVTIGVENAGSFKDYVSIYDDDYNEYSAIFNLEVQ